MIPAWAGATGVGANVQRHEFNAMNAQSRLE
jgi:hypothetical protein